MSSDEEEPEEVSMTAVVVIVFPVGKTVGLSTRQTFFTGFAGLTFLALLTALSSLRSSSIFPSSLLHILETMAALDIALKKHVIYFSF